MWPKLWASVALAAGSLLLLAPAAHAEDPVDLRGAYVLDTVGAIAGDEEGVRAAIDSLYERSRIQLFVVYVDTFTGAADGDWATQTALRNGLGSSDMLLAIAIQDRNFEISVADDFTLNDAQLSRVESDSLIPLLRDDRWAEAVIASADGYAAEATGVVGPFTPKGSNMPVDDSAPAATIPVLPIVGGVVVIGAGVFIFSRMRRRRSAGVGSSVTGQLSQSELDRRAASLLVQLDDSLKTSEQELGFAVAQFGDEATTDFSAALASARVKVAEAFRLRQKLDDSEPDSDDEKREWTTKIIDLCEAADAELDAQADAFDELRALEKDAPRAVEQLRAGMPAARERLDSARVALTRLESAYSLAATQQVHDNIDQATKLLEFATATIQDAQRAIDAGTLSEAAVAIRSAQASLDQIGQLSAAIDTLAENLAEANTALEAALADTRGDIAAAKALPLDAVSSGMETQIAAAEAALDSTDATDPIASLPALAKANGELEQVFTRVRDGQQQVEKARGMLDATLAATRAQLASANDFIATRRGGIGDTARTRASEADRHLAQATALAVTDPVAALAEAQRASELAGSALQYARADVSNFQVQQRGYGGNSYAGSDGADLGGIVSDWLFGGGGGGGGGWSGGGSGSRSSNRSSSSRTSRSSSFGGSSRSSSRGSSGRSSRGGRF
ncbi:TPM domain-containing protein [Salinibacterium sp. G-O1]|uniref:TPM domain-containing protein n=1 Tax=Salinibacterium sp. G-O1 TaxID=3046208 RepID=UPI0024B8C0DC|nr:TPM domain-containing protein [Salinibacterium sp. G-O1]MDJ0334641.1 TPM domain-containing protein [Salinibacterium sp. G-O1]